MPALLNPEMWEVSGEEMLARLERQSASLRKWRRERTWESQLNYRHGLWEKAPENCDCHFCEVVEEDQGVMSDCQHEWDYNTSGPDGSRWCPKCETDEDCAAALIAAEAEIERLKLLAREAIDFAVVLSGAAPDEYYWEYDAQLKALEAKKP